MSSQGKKLAFISSSQWPMEIKIWGPTLKFMGHFGHQEFKGRDRSVKIFAFVHYITNCSILSYAVGLKHSLDQTGLQESKFMTERN
jgi:hypothetical protein